MVMKIKSTSHMIFNPAIETMPLTKLRKFQNESFRDLVNYVYKHVPFYKAKFDEANIKPEELKTIDELSRLPFTVKTDLRDNYPFGLFAVPPEKLRRIHASSGTTGKPTVVGYTAGDLDIFGEVVARSLCCGGAQPGMKLHNAYGYGLFTGGLGLHAGAEKLGMCVIPVSGGMTDRQLMILQDFQPEVMCCTPSYAQTLAEEVEKRNIPLDALNVKYAILGAEAWTESIRDQVEKGLNVKATNIYGLSEIIGPGVSQEDYEEQGSGSHIWEDHFFPEIVDKDTGEPLPYGSEGILVLTTLTKKAIPLIRYKTNDICSIYYDKDSKRSHIKMSAIKGRSDDMLIIRGVNLFHTQVETVFNEFEAIAPAYQLIVTREKTMDEVEVKVEMEQEFIDGLKTLGEQTKKEKTNALQQNLARKIKNNIGLSMKVTLMAPGTIPRSEGGKLNRIMDKRNW
jgi:phenylacetate-CoA ligase